MQNKSILFNIIGFIIVGVVFYFILKGFYQDIARLDDIYEYGNEPEVFYALQTLKLIRAAYILALFACGVAVNIASHLLISDRPEFRKKILFTLLIQVIISFILIFAIIYFSGVEDFRLFGYIIIGLCGLLLVYSEFSTVTEVEKLKR